MGIGRTQTLIRRITPADIGAGTPGADVGETLAAILAISNASGVNDIAMAAAQQITFGGDFGFGRAAAGVGHTTDGSVAGGALRVGTLTDPVNPGDFGAGLVGAGRMRFRQSPPLLVLSNASGVDTVDLNGTQGNIDTIGRLITYTAGFALQQIRVGLGLIAVGSDVPIKWSSTTSAAGAPDVGLSRSEAGGLLTNDGATGAGHHQANYFQVVSTDGATEGPRLVFNPSVSVLSLVNAVGGEPASLALGGNIDQGDDLRIAAGNTGGFLMAKQWRVQFGTVDGGAFGGAAASKLHGGRTTLTDATPTTVLVITLSDGELTGGTIHYSIHASDGTDHQVLTGSVTFSAVNKGDVYTTAINESGVQSSTLSAGTLTDAWTITTGASLINIQLDANTSLTPTTLEVRYQVVSNSDETVTLQ